MCSEGHREPVTPIQREVEARGQLIAAHELLALGLSRAMITTAVRREEIVRVRQGWYTNPWLPVPLQHAARIGGQLGCVSAAAHWKLWHLDDDRLHVAVESNACQLRSRTSYRTRLRPEDPTVLVHWTGRACWASRVVVPPVTCLEQVARCCEAEAALVVVESALNARIVSEGEWRTILAELPAPQRRALQPASPLSGSGTETLFVDRMRRAGVAVRQQVHFAGVGYVDCLIGERLVIELDSIAHHSDPTEDRRRDAALSSEGCRVLRFMQSQVIRDWQSVETAVMAAITRGDHLPA